MKSSILLLAVSVFIMANAIPLPKKEGKEAKQFSALGNLAGSLMPSAPSTMGLGMSVASSVVSLMSTGNPIEDAQRLYKLYKLYTALMDFLHAINPMTYLPPPSQALTDLQNAAGNLANNLPSIPTNLSELIPSTGRQLVIPQIPSLPPFPTQQLPGVPFLPQVPQFQRPQNFPFPSPPKFPPPPTQDQIPPISFQDFLALLNQISPKNPQPADGAQTPEAKFLPINLPIFPLLENDVFRKIICLLDSLNPFNNQKIDFCFNDDDEGDDPDEDEDSTDEDGDDTTDADGGDTTDGDDGDSTTDADADATTADADDAATTDAAPTTDASKSAESKTESAEETVTEKVKPKPTRKPKKPSKVPLSPERLEELMSLLGQLTGSGGSPFPNLFG